MRTRILPSERTACGHGRARIVTLFAMLLASPLARAEANPGDTGRAAAPIEEIVVRADYRQATLDRLPVSVSVLGSDAIEARQAVHLEQLLGATPNLGFAGGSSRARYLQIRGIGERSQFAEPLNSSVGLVVDGVDYSGLGTTATMFDVRQVEVLRGPQGTRYGANALAGLVNVASNEPTLAREFRVSAEAADYATWRLGIAGGGPTGIDGLQYRIAAEQHRSDGTIDNRTRGDDTASLDERTLRARLRYAPQEGTRFDLTLGHVDVDNGYDNFSLDNDRRPSSDQPGQDRQRSRYAALTWNEDAFAAADLEVRLAADASDIDYGYDEDWVFEGFHPDGYSSTDRYLRDRSARSAEVRLVSTDDGRLFDGRTRWLLGLYGIREEVDLTRVYTFLPAPFESRFETTRSAAYTQFDTDLGGGFNLGVGARIEQREADYRDSEQVRFDPEDTLWGGELALSRLFSDGTLAYASIARGFKAGGFNTDGTLDASLREYGDERSLSLELGLKGALFDDATTYRVALFHMRRSDIQVASSITLPREDGSAEFVDFIGNAASGRNSGAEVEAEHALGDRVRLFAAVGILRTEYRDFVNARGERLDGRDQAQAPRYQFDVGATWQVTPALALRVEAEGKDGFYFDDAHDARADDHVLVHARLAWEGDGWRAALWGRNLLDKEHEIRGFVFGNDPRIGYADREYTQLGEPRRVGVSVSADL